MSANKINIKEKFTKFNDYWAPRVIAEMNDYQIKLVKLKGEFVWHDHKETDEVFIVIEGSLCIELRDRNIELHESEMFVVPKGVEHKPYAREECNVMLIEPRGIINTAEAGGALTAENDVWV